jgi:hypothetical protein
LLPRLLPLLLVVLAACSANGADGEDEQVRVDPPRPGACRLLTSDDIQRPSNDSPVVRCSRRHTAETFAVGEFPSTVGEDIDDPALGAHVFDTCEQRFRSFLGGDESLVMRATLTWAWFRPSQEAWERGARWWRCDVVGGGEASAALLPLPETARDLLVGQPQDRWLTCAAGRTVADSDKIPCSEPHTWRAVTTIVLGDEDDDYPGDRVAEVRTRDFCSDSVGAWLNYPVDYEYGYTYFHEAEWEAGNRRSICWARTDQ